MNRGQCSRELDLSGPCGILRGMALLGCGVASHQALPEMQDKKPQNSCVSSICWRVIVWDYRLLRHVVMLQSRRPEEYENSSGSVEGRIDMGF
ncbi:unnamed protein product [Calypogeia fissa]